MDSVMTKKIGKRQLNKFKKEFLIQKKEILSRVSLEVEPPDVEGDEIDVVQGLVLNAVAEKLSQRDKTKLNGILEALQRIEDGTFGECGECGELISEKRLEALPECKVCVFCAEDRERESKHYLHK